MNSNANTDASRIAAFSDAVQTDSSLGHLVLLLERHFPEFVSDSALGQALGLSHDDIWRAVIALRAFGAEISGKPGEGYRLLEPCDLLLPELLAPRLQGTIFASAIRHYLRLESTNTLAMEAAARGEAEGTVFIAEEQTAGRGRGNNGWYSARSAGIYCSVVLRPRLALEAATRAEPMPAAHALGLSLAAGLAAQAAIAQVTGLAPDLRWPNDVLLNGRKAGGILAELSTEAGAVRFAALGLGINVNQDAFPPELRDVATSICRETSRRFSRRELLAALLQSLDREYRLLCTQSLNQLLRRFEQASTYAFGKAVTVDENGGYVGVTEGLDQRGFLRVRTRGGIRLVLSGGVRASQ